LIVTDPPFFDNVHYSQLADFFFAWQTLHPRGFIRHEDTTRHQREVQDTDAQAFATKLAAVFRECTRILRNDGLLAFTYHHSRAEGWTALAHAIFGAGLSIVNAHPVKAEMSIAAPKSQAKDPIQLDIVLVCRKVEEDKRSARDASAALSDASPRARLKLDRLAKTGLNLSRADRRLVFVSQFLASLGPRASADYAVTALLEQQGALEELVEASTVASVARASAQIQNGDAPAGEQYSFWPDVQSSTL
jgi:putative DNA methylase